MIVDFHVWVINHRKAICRPHYLFVAGGSPPCTFMTTTIMANEGGFKQTVAFNTSLRLMKGILVFIIRLLCITTLLAVSPDIIVRVDGKLLKLGLQVRGPQTPRDTSKASIRGIPGSAGEKLSIGIYIPPSWLFYGLPKKNMSLTGEAGKWATTQPRSTCTYHQAGAPGSSGVHDRAP